MTTPLTLKDAEIELDAAHRAVVNARMAGNGMPKPAAIDRLTMAVDNFLDHLAVNWTEALASVEARHEMAA